MTTIDLGLAGTVSFEHKGFRFRPAPPCSLAAWEPEPADRAGVAHIDIPSCLLCHDTGHPAELVEIRNGYDFPVQCPAWGKVWRAQRFNAAMFPAEHLHSPKSYSATAAPALRTLADSLEVKSCYIHGPVGTGKSYIAYRLGRALTLNRAISVRWFGVSQLLKAYTKAYKDDDAMRKLDNEVDSPRVLILDDLGKALTDHEVKIVERLIDDRYNMRKAIIVTSNYDLRKLADRLDERIASRLDGMCVKVHVDGADRRRT